VEIRISKSKDFACFGVFSAVLGATNDDFFCPRTIPTKERINGPVSRL